MRKVLIVDDEPLARIGIQSMLNTIEGIEIAGTAPNGQVALDLIKQTHPDIVITDIKMPVMTGLELMKEVYDFAMPKPVFIVLTSYEDFEYVRTSINYEACYYLMKLELDKNNLALALEKACKVVDERKKHSAVDVYMQTGNVFVNRFYFNLVNFFFHSEDDIKDMANHLNQNLEAPAYVAVAIHLALSLSQKDDHFQDYSTYLSIMNTIKEGLSIYPNCHFIAWSQETIGIIIPLANSNDNEEMYKAALVRAQQLVKQYFDCETTVGIGKEVDTLLSLSDSFHSALTVLSNYIEKKGAFSVFCYNEADRKTSIPELTGGIQIQKINRHLIRAFESCDIDLFTDTLQKLSAAIDTANIYVSINWISIVLHVIINCLDDGEIVLAEAFSEDPMSYQSIYTCTTVGAIQEYMKRLQQCIVRKMEALINNPKYKIVLAAKTYIQEHIYEKLSLSEVSAAIGVSQNYLSMLFSSCSSLGFNDYVTNLKVQKGRELLSTQNLKVYQVSEILGFENSHYFSKVYKKATGISPSETPFTGDPKHLLRKQGK